MTDKAEVQELVVSVVPIDGIEIGKRFRTDYGKMAELKDSIQREGLIHPIAIARQEIEGRKPFVLLAGGRRLRACIELKWNEIPVRIFPVDTDQIKAKYIELNENMIRKDMHWSEEAELKKAIHEMMVEIHGEQAHKLDKEGWSKKKTAEVLGESPSNTHRDIQLAEAMEKIPALKECTDKNEAMKMLDKFKKDFKANEVREALEKEKANTSTEQMHKALIERYVINDFGVGVKKIPDATIDLVEMDPDYAIGIKNEKKIKGISVADVDYVDIPENEFMPKMIEWVQECYRVLKPGGWIIMWFGMEPWYEPLRQLLVETGFEFKGLPAMWVKDKGQTHRPDLYLGSTWEPFFYARKGPAKIQKQGRSNTFVFKPVPAQRKIHICERPIEMIEEILTTFAEPGSRVLCPFLGSGNTILAGSNVQIDVFGFDLSKEFKDHFAVRVAEGEPGTYKSYV